MASWANLNRRGNPKPNTSFTTNLQNQISNLLIIGRVTDILLNDNDPNKFKTFGEWNGIGTIEYETVDKRNQKRGLAKPLDANYKKLPLINELIAIIPAYGIGLNDNPYSITGFYFPPIGVWNHPHHNAFPDDPSATYPIQNKSYQESELGSFNEIEDQPYLIDLGETFIEKGNIQPLLPFEGDVILEGRWGNSIRFGSSIIPPEGAYTNSWSFPGAGEDGDPIIILRNGQISTPETEGYKSIIESTTNSLSSIYLTSTQQIPVVLARQDYTSYNGSGIQPPTSPSEYSKEQIILSSKLIVLYGNCPLLLNSLPFKVTNFLHCPNAFDINVLPVLPLGLSLSVSS